MKLPRLHVKKNLEYIILISIPILIVVSTIVIIVAMIFLLKDDRSLEASTVTDSFDNLSYIDLANSSGISVSGGKVQAEQYLYSIDYSEFFGTGDDGACTVNTNTNINTGSCVSRANGDAVNFSSTVNTTAGSNTIVLSSSPTGLTAGDEVLIINLQGAAANYSDVGEYETAYIESIDTNTLTLDSNLTNGYDGTTQKIMVQRIPQYTDVTVGETYNFYPSAWDGTKGGVMFFRATGTVTVAGTIHADEKGYRGGAGSAAWSRAQAGEAVGSYGSGSGGHSTVAGSDGNFSGGGAGAGIYYISAGAGGSGGVGGSGGGGGCGMGDTQYRSKAGGGGGGGYGTGGSGGQGNVTGSSGTTNESGDGGAGLYTSNIGVGGGGGGGGTYGTEDLSKVFFGAGGGGGGMAYYTGGNGGLAGGIVMISADTVSVTGSISSDGSNGSNAASYGVVACGNGGASGGGGGASGGSVLVRGDSVSIGSEVVTASGGDGGLGSCYNGGAGGDGRIRVEYINSLSGTSSPSASTYQYPYSNMYGTGDDGACTISADTNFNTGTCVGRENGDAVSFSVTESVSSGSSTVTLSSTPTGLAVGDEILIINLFSTNQNGSNVGQFETAYITEINSNTLSLDTQLENSYDGTTYKIMVQRVPQYTNVTVNNGYTWSPSPWDGTKGGVVFFRASGTVTNNGTITVAGMGYLGGTGAVNYGGHSIPGYGAITNNNGGYGGRVYTGDYNGHIGVSSGGGGGGIGVASSPLGSGGAGSTNVGATGGGGGGSAYERSSTSNGYGGGGGGGGHGTGGEGGQILNVGDAPSGSASSSGAGAYAVAGAPQYAGGGGGGRAFGIADLSLLTFGGGGGGGGAGYHEALGGINNSYGGNGGDGGGAIYISANSVGGSGSILATGANYSSGIGSNGVGGSGAGGAGGAIKIVGDTINLSSATVNAAGGLGGTSAADGGNGGEGRIRIEYGTSLSGTTTPSASEFELQQYQNTVTLQSVDLVSGDGIAEFQSFIYTLSSLPSGTSAALQVSQDGENWSTYPPEYEPVEPVSLCETGGTVSYADGYCTHIFTESGTFITDTDMNVAALVVAGGGQGGYGAGAGAGGGGAGGVLYNESYSVTSQSYSVTVGAGGSGVTSYETPGDSGDNSVFGTLTAIGGGGGGGHSVLNAASGGSGGGGGYNTNAASGTSGQGSAGGETSANSYPGGGGGGASAVGSAPGGIATTSVGGAGGAGVDYSSIFGTGFGVDGVVGGGGGGSASNATPGAGGTGGGGTGGRRSTPAIAPISGTANTGGGGGASPYTDSGSYGAAGGSGVVVIKYPIDVPENPFDLVVGDNVEIDLSGFGWQSEQFFYKIVFDTNGGSATPVLDEVSLNFEATPNIPTIGEPAATSSSSIRWNFTDNSTNEVGFKLFTGDGELVDTIETPNLTYIDETGLNPNTQYTRKISSYNTIGTTTFSSPASIYTLANVPTLSSDTVGLDSITLNAGNTANLEAGSSGLYFNCVSEGCSSGIGEWIQLSSDAVTGLSANTPYTFNVKAKNGDGVETSESSPLSVYTLIETPTISLGAITNSSVGLVAEGVSNLVSGSSGLYFDCTGIDCDAGLNSWTQTTENTSINLSPNTQYTYSVRARNGDEVATSYSDTVSIYTYANIPGTPEKEASTPTTLDLSLDVNYNPSGTLFTIQETSTGYYLNKDTGVLQADPDWGTYSDFVSGGTARVTGLSAGTTYQFRMKAKNGDDVETEYGNNISAKTKVVVTNIPESISVNVKGDLETDLTVDGVESDAYNLRFVKDEALIADIPIDLTDNRDFSDIVADADSVNSKAVAKVTSEHGFTETFDLYVVKGETDYVRICPNALSLDQVTDSCTSGVEFNGPFPEFKNVDGTLVTVYSGTVGEVAYWKIEGLTGTGAMGVETPICGDTILGNTPGEECELNDPEGVSCSWAECNQTTCVCPEEPLCGDGILGNVTGEECESGDPSGYQCLWSECNQTICHCIIEEPIDGEDDDDDVIPDGGDDDEAPDGDDEDDEQNNQDDSDKDDGSAEDIKEEEFIEDGDDEKDEESDEDETDEDKEETKPGDRIIIPIERTRRALTNVGLDLYEMISTTFSSIEDFAEENDGIAGTVVLIPTVTTATAAAMHSGVVFSDIPYRIMQFFLGLMQSIGVVKSRKKYKPWGVVYNSVTKDPINNAVVRLFSISDNLLIATEVTDVNGIFSFAPLKGSYNIKVTKARFRYPSDLVTGKSDLLKNNIYRGEEYIVKKDNQDISINIPLDPIDASSSVPYIQMLGMYLATILIALNPVFLIVGTTISLALYNITGNILNLLIVGLYLLIMLIQLIVSIRNRIGWGVVRDDRGFRVPGLRLGIFDRAYDKLIDVRVTDNKGRYRFILPESEYIIKPYKSDYQVSGKNKGGIKIRKKGEGVFLVTANLTVTKQ